MSVTVYGIPNCDTVKKARVWLETSGIAYAFHDYKKAGIAADKLRGWSKAAGWDALINRSGTTFRKLPDDAKSDLDADKAIALMLAQPSMIRRPVVEYDGKLLIGFKVPEWERALVP